jgi:hypothetical protein
MGDDADEPLVDVDLLFGRLGRAQLGLDAVIFRREIRRHGKIIANGRGQTYNFQVFEAGAGGAFFGPRKTGKV